MVCCLNAGGTGSGSTSYAVTMTYFAAAQSVNTSATGCLLAGGTGKGSTSYAVITTAEVIWCSEGPG